VASHPNKFSDDPDHNSSEKPEVQKSKCHRTQTKFLMTLIATHQKNPKFKNPIVIAPKEIF